MGVTKSTDKSRQVLSRKRAVEIVLLEQIQTQTRNLGNLLGSGGGVDPENYEPLLQRVERTTAALRAGSSAGERRVILGELEDATRSLADLILEGNGRHKNHD